MSAEKAPSEPTQNQPSVPRDPGAGDKVDLEYADLVRLGTYGDALFNERSRFWLTTHTIFVALLAASLRESSVRPVFRTIACLFGMVLCACWVVTAWRVSIRIDGLNKHLRDRYPCSPHGFWMRLWLPPTEAEASKAIPGWKGLWYKWNLECELATYILVWATPVLFLLLYIALLALANAGSQPSADAGGYSHWLAIVAIVISVGALVVNILSHLRGKRQNKISVGQRLIDRAYEINEGFIEHKVKSPYAFAKGLADARALEYTPKAVMLLHQLNLLGDVYQHRDILDNKVFESYEHWARRVVSPWVHHDNDLKDAWNTFKGEERTAETEFKVWISELIDSASALPAPP